MCHFQSAFFCRRDAALARLQAQHEASAGFGSSSSIPPAAEHRDGVGSSTGGWQNEGSGDSSLDDSLAAHFNSIQELSDRQALEELLPRLQDLLLSVGFKEQQQLEGLIASGLRYRPGPTL